MTNIKNFLINEIELFAKTKENFSDKVNVFIDSSLLQKSESRREYLGASLLGHKCFNTHFWAQPQINRRLGNKNAYSKWVIF
jgi:hypothetical protein